MSFRRCRYLKVTTAQNPPVSSPCPASADCTGITWDQCLKHRKLDFPSLDKRIISKKLQILAPQPSAVLAEHRDTARNWQPRFTRTRCIIIRGSALSSLGTINQTAIYAEIPWAPIQPPDREQQMHRTFTMLGHYISPSAKSQASCSV